MAKKNTEASEPNITKVANRLKEAEWHALHAAPESESQEGEELTSNQSGHTQRHKICNAAEGKAFLEEEGLVDPDEAPDIAAMVSTLIQISMLQDTPVMVSNTVHAVTLVLVQIKPEVDNKVMFGAMEKKVEGMIGRAMAKALELLEKVGNSAKAKLKSASTAVVALATQVTMTTASYRDTLQSALNPVAGANTLNIRVWAREGIKTRQILVDMLYI